jgi:hypothetical protein
MTEDDYVKFLHRKLIRAPTVGIAECPRLHGSLFPFQRDIVKWALRRGRAALFEECGLGKSRQALEWSRVVCGHTRGDVLILTPLAVAEQFVREGAAIGVPVRHCRTEADLTTGINVTNYERLHHFNPEMFAGIVLDESSILKSQDSKTRTALIAAFADTPYRLCCTATPAPNDHLELGNHSQFLGIMTQPEMLSMFFVHDGGETQKWRLKGHARDEFWRWVCSWAICVTAPSMLGYSNDGYDLPPLRMHEHIVDCDAEMARAAGMLFAFEARTLNEQRAARRASLGARVAKAAKLVTGNAEQWLVWCDLNSESAALADAIPGAVEVKGSDSDRHKEQAVVDFIDGRIRVLVTKPSICGFGVNLQNCHNAVFVGLSHSFEQWYQATRRIWRFGQAHPVDSHVVTSSAESAVMRNIQRKRDEFIAMTEGMAAHMADITRAELKSARRENTPYLANHEMSVPAWVGSEDICV